MFAQLLAKSSSKRIGERLYASAARQARLPALYVEMGVPDTVPGRFELLTLHVILLVDRLKDASPAAREIRQNLFDAYVSNLDGAIREMGVADLAVGRHMRKLGEVFYGRAQACDVAFQALPDLAPLEAALSRILWPAEPTRSSAVLAAYVADRRRDLAGQGDETFMTGEPCWSASDGSRP